MTKYKLIKSCKILPQVRNIVSNAFLGKSAKLNDLARTLPRSIYEPEQFSGLIYRIHGSIVALIFASGKVIIAGAKTLEELNLAFFEIQQRI